MDGVLYDSMKYHSRAWHAMFKEIGIETEADEFFLYEGMTGAATINLIFQREYGHDATPAEIEKLYARKAQLFVEYGKKEPMQGASRMLNTLVDAGVSCVLVTGSAQSSLLSRLDEDYPGVFPPGHRVTAHDVKRGKPDPEPYLKGLEIAAVKPEEAIVIENAPLGVRAGVAAGLKTYAVTTGPVPRAAFEAERPYKIFSSMPDFADALASELNSLNRIHR